MEWLGLEVLSFFSFLEKASAPEKPELVSVEAETDEIIDSLWELKEPFDLQTEEIEIAELSRLVAIEASKKRM
jgi:hypothetical protein